MALATVAADPSDPDAVDLRLNTVQAERLVAYAKRTLQQEHVHKPLQHALRHVWMDLPPGQWLLPGFQAGNYLPKDMRVSVFFL